MTFTAQRDNRVDSSPLADSNARMAEQAAATHARRDWKRFAFLAAQLIMLLALFRLLNVGQRTYEVGGFFTLASICFGGFVVHYSLPIRFKQPAFVLWSLAGGVLVLGPPMSLAWTDPNGYWSGLADASVTMVAVLGLGLGFYSILRVTAIPFFVRAVTILLIAVLLIYGRSGGRWLPQPAHWWLVGSIFMFRMMLYCLEVRKEQRPQKLTDFMSYFFQLPNFYFPFYPVVDYVTFKNSFLTDDVHRVAQRGIFWIVRGTLQLCVERILYQRVQISGDDVDSFFALLRFLLPPYLMFMGISGQFHIIVGMLHLFGYKLPETNRKYLLADSFIEFWRRANVYWKDFMMNVFYYPIYFRVRRWNPRIAPSAAIGAVFVISMLLHSYQYFWLQGRFELTARDLVFWSTLGALVLATAFRPAASPRPARQAGPVRWIRSSLSRVGVYLTISILWSVWSSDSVARWWDTVIYWR